MRKMFLAVVLVLFVCVPFASAGLIGQGELKVSYTNTQHFHGDMNLNGEITTDLEIFCVENQSLTTQWADYSFLTIDSDLNLGSNNVASLNNYIQAAWIAEQYYNSSVVGQKESAQQAIWYVTGVYNSALTGEALQIYASLNSSIPNEWGSFDTSDWMLAVNPIVGEFSDITKSGRQNFLVRNTSPVPEPATMLLLGVGLIGIAGFGRKKIIK